MKRAELEHLLRAASAITDERDFVVIGSQAILGQFPNAPETLLVSAEADLYPRNAPERSDLVDGAIGELSTFHQTFGYYAHGVDQTTAVLPDGWMDRLVRIHNANTGGAAGWCLEAHDLAVSKLVASRVKTNRIVIAHEDQITCGFGAEIAARVASDLFEHLDAPVRRVGAMDTPVASCPDLEEVILPNSADVLKAIKDTAAY